MKGAMYLANVLGIPATWTFRACYSQLRVGLPAIRWPGRAVWSPVLVLRRAKARAIRIGSSVRCHRWFALRVASMPFGSPATVER